MTRLKKDDWEEDRPREKMIAKGLNALSDADLLAILLRTGSKTETVFDLSKRILLSTKKNLDELGKLSPRELSRNFHGIGLAKAVTIAAAMELGKRRLSSEVLQRGQINSSKDGWKIFYPRLCDLFHEELWAVFLNRSGKIVEILKISQGGVSGTTADIRLILRSAIDLLASGIILGHNHPSGNLKPSPQDDLLTERLKKAARLMDINLLDHLIIAGKEYYSYADEGRIL